METEGLQPKLQEAQKALELALEKARGVDLTEVDTGELIRIEETLVMASKAAKDAVSLRLRLRSQRARATVEPDKRARAPAGVEPVVTDRLFDDIRGTRWRAFAVRASNPMVELGALPEAFRNGWLVFDSENEVRRIAPIPDHWEDLTIEDLRLLCYRATGTPKRKGAPVTPRKPPPTSA